MSARWALVGAALGVVSGVIAFAPAAWLAGAVAAGSGGHVQLVDSRGSVWHGNAQFVLSGGEGSRDALALPGRLEWDLSLTLAGLRMVVQAGCCTPKALEVVLQPAWRGFSLAVADATSQWPAALLAGLGAPWNTIQPQGVLHFSSQGLSVEWNEGRVSVAGNARVDALGMSSRLSTLKPIGSYRLSLVGRANQGPPALQLQTLDGSLSLSGSGQLTGTRWSFLGEASAAPERASALGNLLNMVGRRRGAKSVISLG